MTTVIFNFPIGTNNWVEVHREVCDYDPEIGVAVYPHSDTLHHQYEILYRITSIDTKTKKRVAIAHPATEEEIFVDGRKRMYDLLLSIYGASIIKVVSELPTLKSDLGFNALQEMIEREKLLAKMYKIAKKELKKRWSVENDS